MGLFGNPYKNPLIPNCRIDQESNTITCDTEKIVGDQTMKGKRAMTFTVNNGKLIPLDDGGQPEKVIDEVRSYIKKHWGK